MNCGFEGWISSLIIDSYGYVSREAICEFWQLNPDTPAASATFGFVLANFPIGRPM